MQSPRRAGIPVGGPPSNLLTFDAGLWLGGSSINDESDFRPFLRPMVGVGYYW